MEGNNSADCCYGITAILGDLCGLCGSGLFARSDLEGQKISFRTWGSPEDFIEDSIYQSISPGCRRPVCCPRTELVEFTKWTVGWAT
jgi:hypothetical protein